ncbi:hypothetical protein [Clostridium sp.]|jgi:hypothetical protein|uniref:hypothetical protein n=1 Tax=Clostridium sp. TaxID=1506 RepID=UPI003EEF9C69
MRIVFNEIKKIFNFKMVIIIMFISLIMYYLFISFDFEYFPNGRPEKDNYKISIQMVKDYGTSMDKKEFINFKQLYNNQIQEANKYLKARPEFAAVGITTYEKFKEMGSGDEELDKLHNKAFYEDKVDIFWELETREWLIERYEGIEHIDSSFNKNQIARYNDVVKNGSITSILPSFVFKNYNNLIKNVAMLIVLNIIFMISPIYIKDSINKVNQLQYTSKTGRKTFKTKILAALISSFIIISIQLACFFMLYSHNKVGLFLNSSINSVFNFSFSWYNINFVQYIALTVAAVYVLCFAVTLIVTFISRIAPNYITLIGVQVPITFIVLTMSSKYLMDRVTTIWFPKYFQPLAYFILVSIGVILIAIRGKKEKVIDIIN